jgi:ubiquinone/menaquinone biosynthesis C-methylase UbiE
VYQPLEYATFGKKLERQRFAFVDELGDAKRALLLGDGDGRFLFELAKRNADVQIDYVEASGQMIAIARRRLRSPEVVDPGRIRFRQCDAREGGWPSDGYDVVVSHFFLDCFSDAEISQLIPAIRSVCRPGAKWLIAEFQVPKSGWRRWHARCWLKTMYLFFRITTGIETSRLPEYRTVLSRAGFLLRCQKLDMAQLICSELWELPADDAG